MPFFSTVNNSLLLILARLPYKTTGAVFVFSLLLVTFSASSPKSGFMPLTEKIAAKAFPITQTTNTEKSDLGFSIQEVPDPTLPVGEKKIIRVGKTGSIEKTIRSLAFQGNIFTKDTIETKTVPPTNQVIAFGTKKIYETISTSDGEITYWGKLNMYSTSYDSSCKGCNQTTATGMKTGFGVVAVDPKIIPLKTKLYIPGYGFAVAGDTGGSIKGHKIDLGFDDVKKGWWSARFTDVYLLSE